MMPKRRQSRPGADRVTTAPAAARALTALVVFSWSALGCSLATNLDSLSSARDRQDAAVLDSAGDSRGGSVAFHPVGDLLDGPMSTVRPDGSAMEDGAASVDAPTGDVADDAGASDRPTSDGGAVVDAPTSTDVLGADSTATPDADTETGSSDAGADALQMICPLSPPRTATLQLLNANSGATTACGFARADLPALVASVDPATFAASAACGGCLRIETPAAVVVATLVDLGAARTTANATTVAVNRAALSLLVPDGSTYVDQGVGWRFVPCSPPAGTGMAFLFQPGSNASYAALLIQNHRFRIDSVEYRIGGVYHRLTRTSYNYWVAQNGMGGGPFTLRITDVLGNEVEQTGVPLVPGVLFQGQAQFPPCREAAD